MAGLGTSDGKGAGGPSPFYTEARARTRRISSRPAENDCLILSIRNAVLSIISAYVHICTSFPLLMFHQTPLSSERRRPEPSVYHVRMDINQHIRTLFICRPYLSCQYKLVHPLTTRVQLSIRQNLFLANLVTPLLRLFFPLLRHVPIIHSCRSNFQRLQH